MKLLLVLVGILALVALSEGHGRLTAPAARPYSYQGGANAPAYTCNGPTFGTSPTSMRCHDVKEFSTITAVQAGSSLTVEWTMEAAHPGDCSIWLSYDSDKAAPANWIKLKDLPGCLATNGLTPPSKGSVQVHIPAELPPCDHCVLRWEWAAVQQVSNVEFYVNCADIKITGGNSKCAKPQKTTAISGIEHLLKNHHAGYSGSDKAGGCPFYNAYNGAFDPKRSRGPLEWTPECGASSNSGNNDNGSTTHTTPKKTTKPKTNTNTNTNTNTHTTNNNENTNTNTHTNTNTKPKTTEVSHQCLTAIQHAARVCN